MTGIPPEILAEANRLRQAERLPWVNLADRIGYHYRTLVKWLRAAGYDMTPLPTYRDRWFWTPDRIAQFVTALQAGATPAELASRFSVSLNSVYSQTSKLRKAGLPGRPLQSTKGASDNAR